MTDGEIRIRPGTDRDVEEIAHVHRRSRAWYYGTEADPGDRREAMWSSLIAQPWRTIHVAERSQSMVGFMSAIRMEDLETTIELAALYVLPERIGEGVGPRLYDQFDTERRDADVGLLEVWSGNARATAFYVRRGWTPTATTRPGPQDFEFVTYRLAPRHQPG